jgi:hypothetical protein
MSRLSHIDAAVIIALRELGLRWKEIAALVRAQDGSALPPESLERLVRNSGLPYRKGVFRGRRGRKAGGHAEGTVAGAGDRPRPADQLTDPDRRDG